MTVGRSELMLADLTIILAIHLPVLNKILLIREELQEAGAAVLYVIQQSLGLYLSVHLVLLSQQLAVSEDEKLVLQFFVHCQTDFRSRHTHFFCQIIHAPIRILVNLLL